MFLRPSSLVPHPDPHSRARFICTAAVALLICCSPLRSPAATLYATDVDEDVLVSLDPTTGAGTAIGPLGFDQVNSLAYVPELDQLFGIDWVTNQLLTIDRTTGAATAVGPEGFMVGPGGFSRSNAMAYDANTETLFAFGNRIPYSTGIWPWANGHALFAIDTTTGEATYAWDAQHWPSSMTFHPDLGLLAGYDVTYTRNNTELARVGPEFGSVTRYVIGLTGLSNFNGLAYDEARDMLFAVDSGTNSLHTIDAVTGASLLVGPTGFETLNALEVVPTPIPVPALALPFACCLAWLVPRRMNRGASAR